MGRYIRLSLAIVIGILLSINVSFADTKGLKYSMPPTCNKEGKVVCRENEVPVCFFDSDENSFENNIRYVPSCSESPICVVEGSGVRASINTWVECIEFPKYDTNDIAHCSEGKKAICRGNDKPLKRHCPDGSDPICDYRWEVSNVDSNLH